MFVPRRCCFPTTRPRVSHRLPTAAHCFWGSRPWTARGKRSLPRPAPSRPLRSRARRCCRVPTAAPAPRVFHASSTAPVPRQTGGAVVEGWETQLRLRLNGAMFLPATSLAVATAGKPAEFEKGDVPDRGGTDRTCVRPAPVLLPDHPAPRFPRPAQCRCAVFGDRARRQAVENVPCKARHRVARRSREHYVAAVFEPCSNAARSRTEWGDVPLGWNPGPSAHRPTLGELEWAMFPSGMFAV